MKISLRRIRASAPVRHRVVCVPAAGAGPSSFLGWERRLPPWTEVWAAELPGHGRRLFERPCDDGRAIVEALGASLDVLEGAPFHLFGHSFGGTLAGELLRANPDLPGVRSLIVSASVPPHLVGEYLAQADGTRLLRAIEAQTARRAPSPRALQPFLHRALEADLAALRSLSGGAGEPLRVPTVAFAGTSDRVVPFGAMRRWYEQAGSDFCLIAIPGGHFSYAERHASCFFNGVARWLEAVGPGSS